MTTTDESRPAAQEPKPIYWKAWLSLPRVALWKCVALVNSIDPESLRQSDNGWMAGPGNGPVFESSSFSSASKRDAFDDAMGWAERAAGYGDGARIRLTVGLVHGARYRNAEVSLTEVVAYFVGMDWPGIPAPLLGAMKPLTVDANTQASESAPAAEREAISAKRIAEGLCFIDEAAKDIALQQGWTDRRRSEECDLMVEAAKRGALTVRHPSNGHPIEDGQRISTACFVKRDDVNRWLDAKGVVYRWAAEPKPQTEPMVAPLLAQADTQPAPDGAEAALMPGGGKRWTPEVLAEAAAYRAMHNTKATAEKYGVSASLIRKLLPREKPAQKVFGAFISSQK